MRNPVMFPVGFQEYPELTRIAGSGDNVTERSCWILSHEDPRAFPLPKDSHHHDSTLWLQASRDIEGIDELDGVGLRSTIA